MDRPYATIVDAELNPNLQTIGQHSNSRHSESKPIYFAVNERAITSIRLGGTTKVRFGRYIGNVLKPFFNLRQSRSWQIPNWQPNEYAGPSTTTNFFTIVSWMRSESFQSFLLSCNAVSYTHLRAHETDSYLVCRLLLEKKNDLIHLENQWCIDPAGGVEAFVSFHSENTIS